MLGQQRPESKSCHRIGDGGSPVHHEGICCSGTAIRLDHGWRPSRFRSRRWRTTATTLIVILAGYEHRTKQLSRRSGFVQQGQQFDHFDDYTWSCWRSRRARRKIIITPTGGSREGVHDQNQSGKGAAPLRAMRGRKFSQHHGRLPLRERAFRLSGSTHHEVGLADIRQKRRFRHQPHQLFGDDIDDLMAQLHHLVGLEDVKKQVSSSESCSAPKSGARNSGHQMERPLPWDCFFTVLAPARRRLRVRISERSKSIGVFETWTYGGAAPCDDLVGQICRQTGPKTLEKIRRHTVGCCSSMKLLAVSSSESDFGYGVITP